MLIRLESTEPVFYATVLRPQQRCTTGSLENVNWMPQEQTKWSSNVLFRNKPVRLGICNPPATAPLGMAVSPAQLERHVHSTAAKSAETFPTHFTLCSSYCDTCYCDSRSTLSTKKHEDEMPRLTPVLKGTRLPPGLPAGSSSPSTWHHLLAWPGPAAPPGWPLAHGRPCPILYSAIQDLALVFPNSFVQKFSPISPCIF